MSDFGKIKDYIIGASVKRLSKVECEPDKSNQHELNGTAPMKVLLGESKNYSANFIRLSDDEDEVESSAGKVTWYDSRRNDPTRSAEFRFYYQKNPAIDSAQPEDPIAIILKKDNNIVFVTAPKGSQSELDLYDLFGGEISSKFNILDFTENQEELNTTKRFILEELGIEAKANFGQDYLQLIESRFGELTFPKTKLFSALAREVAGDLASYSTSDQAIIHWWETEEAMFRQLEGAMIDQKLSLGFSDADDFLAFSQTIRQRRNSRAGHALENHLAHLFEAKGIQFSWEPKTENNKKPDFIFPTIDRYRESKFPTENLTMLGVKTTCKDRWRQVLTEANRIENKHLFTLQHKISPNQTKEMIDSKLQLVIPLSIHSTYTEEQRNWLWDFDTFIDRVIKIQHA